VWGVQFHPEVTAAQVASWLASDGANEGVDVDAVASETAERIAGWNDLGDAPLPRLPRAGRAGRARSRLAVDRDRAGDLARLRVAVLGAFDPHRRRDRDDDLGGGRELVGRGRLHRRLANRAAVAAREPLDQRRVGRERDDLSEGSGP
jgi:hypothetical protein